ncbi:MAG: class I SAM-dependent methyltransferase [Anaerolineae bacterium]|nr:class I SAM-dependent methyltransferase [Anaerolineae bacterium]
MNPQSDRARWNKKYLEILTQTDVNPTLERYANLLKAGRVLDLAGGLGQNGAWLAGRSDTFRVINADISEVGLCRASAGVARVVVDAGALPFPKNSFDTILNFRFYDPRVRFADWLADGGAVLFQTFTSADIKYRPDFSPAHRFPLEQIPIVFDSLEILHQQETDDGHRIYVTIFARKP